MKTYNQIYIMLVWGVKYRDGFIDPAWEDKLYTVMGNLLKEMSCQPLKINGDSDHVHVLFSLGSNAPSIKDITRILKSNSSKWINDNRLLRGRFEWQMGCGRFSYSIRELNMITNYVSRQKEHHRRFTFREEMQRLFENSGQKCDEYHLPETPA